MRYRESGLLHVRILVKRRLPTATALIIPIMMEVLGYAGGASGLPRDNPSAGTASAGADGTDTISLHAPPDDDRMARVNGHGNIHADGWRAYVNHALSHYTVGLEFRDHEVRVWFFDVLLGAFDPRTQQSVEPIVAPSERGS